MSLGGIVKNPGGWHIREAYMEEAALEMGEGVGKLLTRRNCVLHTQGEAQTSAQGPKVQILE